MLFIDNGSVVVRDVDVFSTSAAGATVATVTAAIPAVRMPGVCNAVLPTASINKALKEDSIIGIVNGCGASVSDAA